MKRIQSTVFCLSAILFAASLLLNIVHYSCRRTCVPVTDTTTVTIYDTISYHNPVPQSEKPAGIISGRLPLASPGDTRSAENIPMFEDLESIGKGKPSLPPPDSADVEIPITQTMYRDSDYTAYVSGYAARLDSLTLTRRREVLTVTREVPPPGRRKRWGISIQAGAGLCPSGRPDFAPYVGIGVSYNLFTF